MTVWPFFVAQAVWTEKHVASGFPRCKEGMALRVAFLRRSSRPEVCVGATIRISPKVGEPFDFPSHKQRFWLVPMLNGHYQRRLLVALSRVTERLPETHFAKYKNPLEEKDRLRRHRGGVQLVSAVYRWCSWCFYSFLVGICSFNHHKQGWCSSTQR